MKTKTTFVQRICMGALAIGAATMTLMLAPTVTRAQLVVWSTTNFVYDPLGTYGAFVDFQGGENVAVNIVTPGEGGGNSQALEITFDPNQPNINLQTTTVPYPCSGNTNAFLANYTLSFDMKISGVINLSPAGGIQISLFPNQNGANGYGVFGSNLLLPNTDTNVFTAGTGYQHYSISLGSFKNSGVTIATTTNFSFGLGDVAYPANLGGVPITIDIDNLQITMATNPPAPPRPSMHVLPAKRGLRVFQQASDAVYTQEGIATEDFNQSWVGLATPSTPVKYAITFQDFDTVANYAMNIQFTPNAGTPPYGPYAVYNANDDLVWTIRSGGGTSGFTTALAFKTNSPANVNGFETNIVVAPLTTTSTNGRGTWTLTFTTDTNGTVTAPDGTSASFVLDPNMTAQFVDPLTIFFGTSAGATGGFGQFTDISKIAVTNVGGLNESDDFTSETNLDPTVWDPSFSRDAGSVILVSSAPSYWANWTIPDDGFGLETKAGLNGGTNVWFSPNYYGSGTGSSNTPPTLMGTTLKWTWVPNGCLPTVNGTVGGAPSPNAFFRLSSPPPSQ
jgi:hypothetical protein